MLDCPSVTKFEGVRILDAFSGAPVFVSFKLWVSSSLQKTQADRWLGRALAESHHLPSPSNAFTCPNCFLPNCIYELVGFYGTCCFLLTKRYNATGQKKKKSQNLKSLEGRKCRLLGLSQEFSEFPWRQGPLLPHP